MGHFWVEVNAFWFLNEPSKLYTKYNCNLLVSCLKSFSTSGLITGTQWERLLTPFRSLTLSRRVALIYRRQSVSQMWPSACRCEEPRDEPVVSLMGAPRDFPAHSRRGKLLCILCLNSTRNHFQSTLLCLPELALAFKGFTSAEKM